MDRVYWLRIRNTSPQQVRSAAQSSKVDLYAISASGGQMLVASNVPWEKVAGVLAPILWARKVSDSESILWNEKELKALSDDFRAVPAA
jgi:hypothetical protein